MQSIRRPLPEPLAQETFASTDTVRLARELLGRRLVAASGEGRFSEHVIVETEAYDGPEDRACHASKGRTKRTEPMFGPPGHWYIYFVYGMHEMLNLATGPVGYPAAILIRGLADVTGPGRLTKRLGINRRFNALPAAQSSGLYLAEAERTLSPFATIATPRIGVDYAGPDWAARPYRFVAAF